MEGHVELYIRQNGVYYAVNPVAYTRDEEHEPIDELYGVYHPETSNSSATDFMYIAQGLARDFKGGVYLHLLMAIFLHIPSRKLTETGFSEGNGNCILDWT